MDKQNYFTYIDNTSDNTDKTMKNLYKQIIIDGVDVSGCKYLFDDTSYKRSKTSCSITLKDCKYLGNNCYYKQLRRKEQECEILKINNAQFIKDNEFLAKRNSKHKAENEKLDTENKRLVAELANPVFDSFEELDQLKATLQEIKEIVEIENNDIKVLYNRRTYQRIKQILQKIKECKTILMKINPSNLKH